MYPPTNNSLLSSGNVKKSTAYEPRTEAISPALNDDIISADETTSKSTKDEQTLLVEKLKKVEADILQTDLLIVRLRRQKEQLEQAANSVPKDEDDQENVCDTKQLSIAKLIYHENRSKAQKAHAKLECLGGIIRDLPIYNQPSDNAIHHHNAAKFIRSFKTSLIGCFRIRQQNRLKLEETVSAEYDRRMEKWLKSIEQEDSQPTKRVKDAKTREFYEKQFPELKKARESGERFSRVGQRVARSDAELDELLDGITEREDQDKKVKSYAVIPPMLEEMRSTKPKYINKNGYVEDIEAEYKEYQILNTWTDEEKDIFRENYLQHPKDFGLIARMASRKNVANCVHYYYMSKKSENYKQLLKRQQKRRTRSFVRPAQATPANPVIETNVDTTNSGKAANGATNNDKQSGDCAATNTDSNSTANQLDGSKQSALSNITDTKPIIQDISMDVSNSNQADSACCVCNCNFNDNQFRFRHVKHPSFDEPSDSPDPFVDDQENSNNDEVMEVDTPLAQIDSQPVIESNTNENKLNIPPRQPSPPKEQSTEQTQDSNNGESNKGPQRVRDIIYQAIEMSFQDLKPKLPEPMDSQPIPGPHNPECAHPNQGLAQHQIPDMTPPKQVGANHTVPNTLPTPHSSIQSISLERQQQLQLELQQKQRQQVLEYNLRQHQLQVQMQQQRQLRHQPFPHSVQPHLAQPMLARHPTQFTHAPPLQPPQLRHDVPNPLQPPPHHLLTTANRYPEMLPFTPPNNFNRKIGPGQAEKPSPVEKPTSMAHHPLDLCRKYNELVPPAYEPLRAHTQQPKPPLMHQVAHSARGSKARPAPRVMMDEGVLNLSAKSLATPATNLQPTLNYSMSLKVSSTPPLSHQPPPPPPPQDTITSTPMIVASSIIHQSLSSKPPATVNNLQPALNYPMVQKASSTPPLSHLATDITTPAPMIVANSNPHQNSLAKPPAASNSIPELEKKAPSPSLANDDPNSPNLTGSPTSQGEMVIDESAVQSPPTSPDQEEKVK